MTAILEPHSSTAVESDERAIRKLIDDWARAFERKDVDGMMANYADDAVLFDAIPPHQTVGRENIHKVWEQCLPCFPDGFKSEHRDLTIHVAGDVAFCHGFHKVVLEQKDHPAGQTWLRVTVGYRKIDGAWKVVHDHVSIPFNPIDGNAFYIADPDKPEMIDFGAMDCASK